MSERGPDRGRGPGHVAPIGELPAMAAGRHVDVREGFEVIFLSRERDGLRLDGQATGVEEGEAWGIRYTLVLDARWTTRSARIAGRSSSGAHDLRIEADGAGGWTVDGAAAPALAGCMDVDLEASAFTNALPVNRLGLEVGEHADAPAAYVRAVDLEVERLEQSYARVPDDGPRSRYDYEAPDFEFAAVLTYDRFGLILDYPGIAVRVA